ncbi:Imm50 family immunity protein [Chitinimonas naiadis]
MLWVDALDNKQAVTTLFERYDDFVHIDLHEMTAHRDGPVLRLWFDIRRAPSPLPAKWQDGCNTTQFIITVWQIKDLEVYGWAKSLAGELRIAQAEQGYQLGFFSTECRFTVRCALLHIERMTGYVNRQR